MMRKKMIVQIWQRTRWIESVKPRLIEASKLCKNPRCNRILPSRKARYWQLLAKSLGNKRAGFLEKGNFCSPGCRDSKNLPGLYQFSIGGPCSECGSIGAIVFKGKKLCWICYEAK